MPRFRLPFKVGQRISYPVPDGRTLHGKILEVKPKKVVVRNEFGFRQEVQKRKAKIL